MSSISNSTQTYHYPPVFQDNPTGNCLTGPIQDNQPYEVLGENSENKESVFVKDIAYPKMLWAKSEEGVLVKNSDGELIYVPPRPSFKEDLPDDIPPNPQKLNAALAAVPPNHSHNPCPSGLPNNPYAPRTTADHQLMNVINNWWNQQRYRPSHEDCVQHFRRHCLPLFRSIGPTSPEMASVRQSIANIGKIDLVKKIIENTTLSSLNLSEDQLLKLANMRVYVDQIMNIIDENELWDEFPIAGSMDQIYDQEICKSPKVFKKFIHEISSFSSRLPNCEKKSTLLKKEQAILEGWNCLQNRDEHLQAFADVLFESNLKIQAPLDWEERILNVREKISSNIRIIGEHIPTTSGDLVKIPCHAFLGFIDGIVNFSNDPIYSPIFSPLKKYTVEELYPVTSSRHQMRSILVGASYDLPS